MRFTGRNTARVRAWVHEVAGTPPGTAWFLTRSQSAPTGGQAWRYVKGDDWPDDVAAALFDPGTGEWLPVRRGDEITYAPSRFTVTRGETHAH